MPKKPVKWGIKVWVCADSVNGYIYTFDIYCGANSSQPSYPNGLGYEVVMKLLAPCLNKGYTVYMDNFYASPKLFKDLLSAGTYACGTLRTNRKNFPDSLKPKAGERARPRGTPIFAFCDKITVDNKDVYALSTLYSDSLYMVRRQVDSQVKNVTCPDIISAFMGGVDLADQVMCYYSVGRKTMKWWRRVFWRMYDHAITNACYLFQK